MGRNTIVVLHHPSFLHLTWGTPWWTNGTGTTNGTGRGPEQGSALQMGKRPTKAP